MTDNNELPEQKQMTEIFALIMLLWRAIHGEKSVIEQMTPCWGLEYEDIKIYANCSSTNWEIDINGLVLSPYNASIIDTESSLPICSVTPFEGHIYGLVMDESQIVKRLEGKVNQMLVIEKEYKCSECGHVVRSVNPISQCPECQNKVLIISIDLDGYDKEKDDHYVKFLTDKDGD